MKRSFNFIFALLLFLGGILTAFSPQPASAGEKIIHILCSTFPIAQITRNVTQGRGAAQVDLMLPAQLGCPHDYALTPKDMQLLAGADVLVVNGLGLEEFLGAPIQKANPAIAVIDSSKGVDDIIHYSEVREQGHGGHADHEHQGANPHLFVSPRLVANLVMTIAIELARIDPAGGEVYRVNGEAYAAKMASLDQEFVAIGRSLTNKRIITQHGVFDYLARDMGLEVVAVVEAHAGQEPSAAEMLAIIKTAKARKAGAIFSEPQYPAKVVQTIAREAGIVPATLDPVATGPEDAALDYYERVMVKNMDTLKSTLGAP
jgi:zinc transport system substrate-binding protein